MFQLFKLLLMGAAAVVALVVFALSCVVLMFFPEWVRFTAAGIVVVFLVWFIFFGRFRRRSGLLINDGTVYDRWNGRKKVSGDFL